MPISKNDDHWTCNSCGEKTSDISPLGPAGVIICEDCANPRNPSLMARHYVQQEAPESKLSSHTLAACPFCGDEPTVTDTHSDEIRRRDDEARANGAIIPEMYAPWKSHFLNIKCRNCDIGFDGTLVDGFTEADVRKSREKLLTKWNTRKLLNNQ
jgi:hypothetical protein